MIARITSFLIDNRILTSVFVLMVVAFGLISSPFDLGFEFLPKNPVAVDAIPNIGENQQIVFTEWDGQSPRDIEDQITYPLTSNLLGIPGVKSIRSNSMFGYSSIYIVFEENIEFYWSRARVLEKLNSLSKKILPNGVQPKLGPDATSLGQLFWYTLEGRDSLGNVTSGWDPQELRTIQDFYVKNALSATHGVAEVASIGGFVKEYQIDVNPELLKQYGISLQQVVDAVKSTNRDVGAQTLEINQAEYFVRGLGYIESIEDIQRTSIVSNDYTPITVGDIAQVYLGPAERRGILDKGGAEVVGGVVTARFGANPMKVIESLKESIAQASIGLPKKTLKDGRTSQLTIVPFYDRSDLILESLNTLGNTLTYEILIAIFVILVMLRSLKVSFIVSGLMPLAVLMVFIAMKVFGVDANIVALSGIAIAIGTVVDLGIILSENIVRHQQEFPENMLKVNVKNASKEVSGAILTAGLTTILSFVPVFVLTGPEGKLFFPLAFTKTIALIASIGLTLFVIPSLAVILFNRSNIKSADSFVTLAFLSIGFLSCLYGLYLGLFLVLLGLVQLLFLSNKIDRGQKKWGTLILSLGTIIFLLTLYWKPLGIGSNLFTNGLFISILLCLVLLPLRYFMKQYEVVLSWVLRNKWKSIAAPILFVILGITILSSLGKEFMPTLDEGDFLLMPTSLPQAGTAENSKILKQLDIAVASLPEVEYVVGKAGRVESALDPAPLSMYENLISYKTEYILDEKGNPMRFETNKEGYFKLRSGGFIASGSKVKRHQLVENSRGEYYRNWRAQIKNEGDIWNEIAKITRFPGVTSSPRLQPIETRLIMLQTGMRSNLGIKVKGQNLEALEAFSLLLEEEVKKVDGIRERSVFADRIVGKPYVLIAINRDKIARYSLRVEDIQQTLEVAIGGKILGQSIEGRERYSIRIRYPRELRGTPEALKNIYVDLPNGGTVPLSEFVEISYEQGPQSIKSEDGFLVNYVIFDKVKGISEVSLVESVEKALSDKIESGELIVPHGINYVFSGTFENHAHAQKTLGFIIPLVLVIILLLLYLQFRSISVSLMVFSNIAVAFSGGFIMIWLFGQPWFMNMDLGFGNFRELFNIQTIHLSVAVWVGFIALFGIATDDGVVMATYLKQSFRDYETNDISSIRDVVVLAGKKRIRPCLITTATTLLALLPILMSSEKGSNIMIPMAIPVFGGMLMALITLFVVPLLFCWKKEIILKKQSAG
ncbi:efflux RND transporter permease subunit [uncultured Croceitalea sp.]|uniref:efflux RND transporter permease subunit n=1 Tax=uncultured Croceitalea sp. TaxID=1798908 RepID=UPI00330664A4